MRVCRRMLEWMDWVMDGCVGARVGKWGWISRWVDEPHISFLQVSKLLYGIPRR